MSKPECMSRAVQFRLFRIVLMQKGIGLPELLIALFLASIILMVLMRHYLDTKQQYHHIQREVEQSIELQLVTDLIRNSSRRAGFTPCAGIDHLKSADRRQQPRKLVAIEVSEGALLSLQMNRMSESFDSVLDIITPVDLLTTERLRLHRGQSVLIADCYHAEVQKVNQVRHTTAGYIITVSQPLAFTYHAPIYLGAWIEESYFIHREPHGETTLFYRLLHAEELTTVVHHLRTNLQKYQGRTLIRVSLLLDHARQVAIETMVRTR